MLPISFSFTDFVDQSALLVLDDSDINSLAQLDCKKVAVWPNTTQYDELIKYQEENSAVFHLRLVTDNSVGLALLKAKKVKAWYGQVSLLKSIVASSNHPSEYAIVGYSDSYEPLALMMRKENQILNGLVNKALLSIFENGIIDKIYKKWFLSEIPPDHINLNIHLNNETRYVWENPNTLPQELYPLY